jgi:Ca2+-binding EF-hand superfamily protein
MNQIIMEPYKHQDFFEVFNALDINGDRMLDINEFKAGYSKYYGIWIEDSELEKLFNGVDIDGSGEIDFSEFMDMNNTLARAPALHIL